MVEIQIPVSIVNVLDIFIPCIHILLSCYAVMTSAVVDSPA